VKLLVKVRLTKLGKVRIEFPHHRSKLRRKELLNMAADLDFSTMSANYSKYFSPLLSEIKRLFFVFFPWSAQDGLAIFVR
jgi:hypothetical protein